MTRFQMLFAGAVAGTICCLAPLATSAAPTGSDANMRYAAARIERDIDLLQRDQHDYNGDRVATINDLQQARSQIGLGLAYDAGAESQIAALKAQLERNQTWMRGAESSDCNLFFVRRDVEQIIDLLQRDSKDYGGHRVYAIGELQKARQEIVAALVYDASH